MIHVITPVKDSWETTRKTIESVMGSCTEEPFEYTIYNDYSTAETREKLEACSREKGFRLVHLEDITTHPSPNYLTVLRVAQERAIAAGADLVIIESDVEINPDTLARLRKIGAEHDKVGLVASATHDTEGAVNFPYLFLKGKPKKVWDTKKRLSFCCTMISRDFLGAFPFAQLSPEKQWYDVFISHKAHQMGFHNLIDTEETVLHKPHSSRPWKMLKYTSPIKYYWRKFTRRLDRI